MLARLLGAAAEANTTNDNETMRTNEVNKRGHNFDQYVKISRNKNNQNEAKPETVVKIMNSLLRDVQTRVVADGCTLSDYTAAKAVVDWALSMTVPFALDVDGCSFNHGEMTRLLHVLQGNCHVRVLDIDHNDLTDNHFKQAVNLLKTCPNLIIIYKTFGNNNNSGNGKYLDKLISMKFEDRAAYTLEKFESEVRSRCGMIVDPDMMLLGAMMGLGSEGMTCRCGDDDSLANLVGRRGNSSGVLGRALIIGALNAAIEEHKKKSEEKKDEAKSVPDSDTATTADATSTDNADDVD